MEEKLETKQEPLKGKRLIIALSVAAVVVILCAVLSICAVILSSDKIYQGVFIGELNVSGMTIKEAKEAVLEHYTVDTGALLTLSCGDVSQTVSAETLSPSVVPDKMVEAAYSFGREGSVFSRLKTIHEIKKQTALVPAEAELNEDVLLETIRTISVVVNRPEQDTSYEVSENELIITLGHSGKRINEEQAIRTVAQKLMEKDVNTIELTLETLEPKQITVDYINSEICSEPKNASYHVENGKLIIDSEKIGIAMDTTVAEEIIKSTVGEIIRIPVTVTAPEITAEQLSSTFFNDRLGTYTTRYNAGDINRSYNISLASQNINELVLAPGDVFSYNDSVGPRTAARGFRMAHVYVGNKVEDGIGGGICQVSSTLYNTVVLSDLKIVTRTNHSLPVSYAPMGRDATVSYGSIDFKFENNTDAPIKIVAVAGGGQNTISIYGTKANPNRSISIESVHTATYPAKLEQIEDPTLPEGTVKVEQKGSNGSTYQTYKVISENGTVISREPLAKSTYVSANRIERVGTMPTEATPAPDMPAETVNTQAPAQTESPSAPPVEEMLAEQTAAPTESAHTPLKPSNPAA